jgi:hypothetical protein
MHHKPNFLSGWWNAVFVVDSRWFSSHFICCESLHASDLLLVQVLAKTRVKVLPPLKEHRVTDELEPRSENQAWVIELLLEALGSDVLGISDLVLVDVKVDVSLDKENVVNLMFTPHSVTRSLVVNTGQEVEVLEGNLLLLDTQFVFKLALGSSLDTSDGVLKSRTSLGRDMKRVRAASVGPHIGEGNLLGSALLEEKFVFVVKEENGEGTVKEALVDVGHEMADLLASCANRFVVLI